MSSKNILVIFMILFLLTGCSSEITGIKSKFLSEFKCIKKEKNKFSTIFTYVKGEDIIRIEKFDNIDETSAKKLIDSEIINIKIIYADGLSPYPGEISNKIVAGPKTKPRFLKKTKQGISYRYALLYSNDRFGIGVKSVTSAKYKHLAGWLFSNSSSVLYKIKIYFSIDSDFEDMEKIFLSMGWES